MERFLNFPQCVSVLDQSDVRGNFTDLGGQACEVFLGLFHKYLDPDKPFFRFNTIPLFLRHILSKFGGSRFQWLRDMKTKIAQGLAIMHQYFF